MAFQQSSLGDISAFSHVRREISTYQVERYLAGLGYLQDDSLFTEIDIFFWLFINL